MSNISFLKVNETRIVFLDGKHVGDIFKVEGGYQYFAKGSHVGGEVFATVAEVKQSLTED